MDNQNYKNQESIKFTIQKYRDDERIKTQPGLPGHKKKNEKCIIF